MADFLLELLCEEIPARMQKGARAELEKLFRRELDGAGVDAEAITVWSTPRRLALVARSLPLETQGVREEAKGPPVGAPDQAIDGFCRKNGVTRDQLEERDVKGRATWFAVKDVPGQPVSELLSAAIPVIIRDFSWPKSMRWGEASIRSQSLKWVRPLTGIVALLDGEIVPVVMEGLASGRETAGHRFHCEGAITIDGARDYVQKLREAHVIVDHEERAGIIREAARKAARAAGLRVIEDEGLVVENAGLTEWPVPLLGRFDEAFLDVPPEVIQLTARVNQKYFVCEENGPDGTRLANAFICTANIAANDPAVVVDGNRKVLAARLADARFFWELDQKKTLANHAKGLARITFHEKLGTVADKVERVARLARWLCEEGIVSSHTSPREGGDLPQVGAASLEVPAFAGTRTELADMAEQAARLCKADLVTEMVGEFPELQGLMGGYYAEKEGLPREVAHAIRDHYKPVGQGDDVPTAPVTVAVSLADKLDTVASFFAIDEKPTGSKDPFALRRAAIGLLALIFENGLRIDLFMAGWVAASAAHFRKQVPPLARVLPIINAVRSLHVEVADKSLFNRLVETSTNLSNDAAQNFMRQAQEDSEDLLDFFADRLKVQQREAGVRHDLIDAVFALGAEADLVRLLARVHALQAFVETENGANLLAGYKRAANILKKEEWDSANQSQPDTGLSYTPELAEKALIDALDAAQPKAAAAIEAEDFEGAMAALASLRTSVDAFFDTVVVNDPDKDKRISRLALLARFRNAVHQVADFSRIEG